MEKEGMLDEDWEAIQEPVTTKLDSNMSMRYIKIKYKPPPPRQRAFTKARNKRRQSLSLGLVPQRRA